MSEQLALTAEQERPKSVRAEVGHRERIGLRKLGNPAGFKFYAWEVVGGRDSGDCLLTGCVVTRTYQKGKRKGEPVFDGPMQRVVVTEAEMVAERARYEAETGLCARCLGSGETWAGWHHINGHKYRQCAVCKGGGKATA